MQNKSSIILLVVICACICVTNAQQVSVKYESYIFALPDRSGFSSEFCYVDHNKGEYLRVLNVPRPTIEIFDLKSGSIKRSIYPQVAELGAIIRDGDSFWGYDAKTRSYILIDESGSVIAPYRELKKESDRGLFSYFGNWRGSPLVLYDGRLLTVASFMYGPRVKRNSEEFLNQGVIRVFDTRTKSLSWEGGLSPKARNFNFGYLHRYSCVLAKHYLVISPCFSDELAVYDLKRRRYFFPDRKHNKYSKLITPLSTWDNNVQLSEESEVMRHFSSNPQFTHILYDEFRDVFYRFLYYPSNKERGDITKILVLNSTLDFIREYQIEREYTLEGSFITEDGLNLLNLAKYQEDHNELVFDAFVLN